MTGQEKRYFFRSVSKVLIFLIVMNWLPVWEVICIPSGEPSTLKNYFNRLLNSVQPQEILAAVPEINSSGDFYSSKNQPLGREEILDGTGWYNPSGNPVIYQWFGPFPTTYGPTPLVFLPEGMHTISLIVHEGADWYTAGTASAFITPCFQVEARSKPGKVQLVWSHLPGADHYDVYRSREDDPSNFVKIGETTSTYSTYLDGSVNNEITYLYLVGAHIQDEWCYSAVVASHPTALRSRTVPNYAPVIHTTPITHGTKEIVYNYDVNASDPDGGLLAFNLSEFPAGMSIDPDTGLISWLPDQTGAYSVTVDVFDGRGGTDTQAFTVIVGEPAFPNHIPVADAGPDQPAFINSTVVLDGSGSSDLDGDLLTFNWTLISIPAGSGATLDDPTAVMPAFVVDVSGTYLVHLIVNDGSAYSDPDTVTITTENSKPVADAGPDQTVLVGDSVVLDGSGSGDIDGDPLFYEWSFTGRPNGSSATLSDPGAMNPVFTVDVPGTYIVELLVSDGYADSSPDTVTISTSNSKPVADAGSDQEVLVGSTVGLDGSASTDPDQDPLAYLWSFVTKPGGSTAMISPPDFVSPTFTADAAGTYIVQLVVSDGLQDSDPDSVAIEAGVPVNLPPAADDDSFSVDEDAMLVIGSPGVLENDLDPEGDPITADLQSGPTHGTFTLYADGAFSYMPEPNYHGQDSFTYTASDGLLASNPATATIAVLSINDSPIITSSPPALAYIGEEYAYNVAAQDPDDGDVLAYSLEEAPAGMSINPETGAITWLPADDQSGVHPVIVGVEDPAGLYVRQEFDVTVSDAGECGPGAINVCGRCVPFTPLFGQVINPISDQEIEAVKARLGSIELPFVANQGQEHLQVLYYTATDAGKIYVTRDAKLVYSLLPSKQDIDMETDYSGWTLTETIVGGSPKVEPKESTTAKISYFKGRDPQFWKREVPAYASVSLGEVWPGIKMDLKARSNSVEKVFTVSPEANVDSIRLRLAGAEALRVNENGSMRIETGLGDVILTQPAAWQEKDGRRQPVMVAYNIADDNSYGFSLGSHDPAAPVVIDPMLQATYIGGNNGEWGSDIAVHPATGEVYVTGSTWSTEFPGTEGGAQPTSQADSSHTDLFVVRLSEDLSTLLQATYLGGSGQENWVPRVMIHPQSGDVYISGITRSDDFPGTDEGAQPSYGGGWDDAFVARLNGSLTTLLQATYVGGSGYEGYWSPTATAVMAIHPVSGDVYVAALTSSSNFPGASGGAQGSLAMATGQDGFLVRLSADLRTLIQSSYLGGRLNESITAIDIHPASGDVIAAGTTLSDDFPGTTGGFQESLNGSEDGFAACLNEDLTELLQSTYLGGSYSSPGSSNEAISSLAVHPYSGDLYLAGWTRSIDYPGTAGGVVPPPEPGYRGGSIITRLRPSLASIRQATYLGNPSGGSAATDVKVHPASGDIYVAGETNTSFPGIEGGAQTGFCGGGSDGFVAKLSQDLTQLYQATAVGGTDEDVIRAVAVHPVTGDIYVAGTTQSGNLPGTQGGICESNPSFYSLSAFAERITADLQGDPFNEPPEIAPGVMPVAFIGQPFSYQVEITDPNTHDCHLFWLEDKPSGMMIDDATGLITWSLPSSFYLGNNTIVVGVMDAGGLEDTHDFTLTVQHPPTKPTILTLPVTSVRAGQAYRYGVSAYDPNNDPITYSLDVAPAGMTIDLYGTIRWNPTEADIGVHEVIVRASDPGGLFDTQQFSLTVNPPNHAPSITSSPITSAAVGVLYSYDVEAADPDAGDVLLYGFVQRPLGMTINSSTGLIQWTPSETQTGEHQVSVSASDSGGLRATQSFVISVTSPPTITSVPVTDAAEKALYTYDVEAYDPDAGETLTYVLETSPAGMEVDPVTGLIQWLPESGDFGDHAVTVVVVDSRNFTDSQSFTITVANVNDPPVITSQPLKEVIENNLYEYQVEASDPDPGDTLTYSLDVAPAGMTVNSNTGLIQWAPTEADKGMHDVSVRVEDAHGLSDTQSYALAVGNIPPAITSTPPTTVVEYEQYSYIVEAADPNSGDVLTFSLDLAPEGMTIHAATGMIQWKPEGWSAGGISQVGEHQVIVRVEDDGGLSDTQSFSISVTPAAPSVRIQSFPESLDMPEGTSYGIIFLVTLETSTPGSYTVGYSQSVTPDDGGLLLNTTQPSGWDAAASKVFFTSQAVMGNTIGTYTITTTATINETGASYELNTIVNVTGSAPVVEPTGSFPAAIPIGETTDVLFTAMLSGSSVKPAGIVLEEVDDSGNVLRELGGLVDDGSSGDLWAYDYVFSGAFGISSDTEGVLFFRTKATFQDFADPVYSEVCRLHVTRFPVGSKFPDMSKLVTEDSTGLKLFSDRVLVSFKEGTAPETIQLIVDEIAGVIVGTQLRVGYYQVQIPGNGSAAGVRDALASLKSRDAVLDAEPEFLIRGSSIPPNDPFYDEETFQKIRADKAWMVAHGNALIAVIDSGVDYTHPELLGNVKPGKNYVCDPTTFPGCEGFPLDDEGHGTMVAGAAGAITDNEKGISSVSWGSPVYAVKALDETNSGSVFVLANAIIEAADIGVKLINVSAGIPVGDFGDEELGSLFISVSYAHERGSLVIAAAGNANSDRPEYPAAFPSVIGVGATSYDSEWNSIVRWDETSIGNPSNGSNYGNWVDIAAPGDYVQILRPIYEVSSFNPDDSCVDELDPALPIIPPEKRPLTGCYENASGTSISSPIVAGTGALVLSRFPEMDNDKLRRRLLKSSTPMPFQSLGAGQVDAFEAVFNGSFEADPYLPSDGIAGTSDWKSYPISGLTPDGQYVTLPATIFQNKASGWQLIGYRKTGAWTVNEEYVGEPIKSDLLWGEGGAFITDAGPVKPVHGKRMAFISTGSPDDDPDLYYESDPDKLWHYATFLMQTFHVPAGVNHMNVSFHYDFVTEEPIPDNFTPARDIFQTAIVYGNQIESSNINSTSLHRHEMLEPIDDVSAMYPDSDLAMFHTGWQQAEVGISIPEEYKETGIWVTLLFFITDNPPMPGEPLILAIDRDELWDSFAVIDQVEIDYE